MPREYVSDELIHFVGRSTASAEDAYGLLLKILEEGLVSHPPHVRGYSGNLSITTGVGLSTNELYRPEVVCFCDIPLEALDIHMKKYGPFGLSFLKTFAAKHGAAPVRYVPRQTDVRAPIRTNELRERAVGGAMEDFLAIREELDRKTSLADVFDWGAAHYQELLTRISREYMDAQLEKFKAEIRTGGPIAPESRELTELQRFLDFQVFSFLKFFDLGLADDDPLNFYMEREWRILGNLEFTLADVHRVIIPASYEARFREDVLSFEGHLWPVADSALAA